MGVNKVASTINGLSETTILCKKDGFTKEKRVTFFVGPSGSGKTHLINMLNKQNIPAMDMDAYGSVSQSGWVTRVGDAIIADGLQRAIVAGQASNLNQQIQTLVFDGYEVQVIYILNDAKTLLANVIHRTGGSAEFDWAMTTLSSLMGVKKCSMTALKADVIKGSYSIEDKGYRGVPPTIFTHPGRNKNVNSYNKLKEWHDLSIKSLGLVDGVEPDVLDASLNEDMLLKDYIKMLPFGYLAVHAQEGEGFDNTGHRSILKKFTHKGRRLILLLESPDSYGEWIAGRYVHENRMIDVNDHALRDFAEATAAYRQHYMSYFDEEFDGFIVDTNKSCIVERGQSLEPGHVSMRRNEYMKGLNWALRVPEKLNIPQKYPSYKSKHVDKIVFIDLDSTNMHLDSFDSKYNYHLVVSSDGGYLTALEYVKSLVALPHVVRVSFTGKDLRSSSCGVLKAAMQRGLVKNPNMYRIANHQVSGRPVQTYSTESTQKLNTISPWKSDFEIAKSVGDFYNTDWYTDFNKLNAPVEGMIIVDQPKRIPTLLKFLASKSGE